MEPAQIEQAYEPFVAAYLADGFRPPSGERAWTADQVVAHTTLNNDHWTRAARDVIAGGATAYEQLVALQTGD